MSVALAHLDAGYALGAAAHQHRLQQLRQLSSQPRREEPPATAPLRFSVLNILRPEFGREAILSQRLPQPAPLQSPPGLPRDLSLAAQRLSPRSPPSPTQSSLSRSASLESLASSRGSLHGAASVSSAASSTGADSLAGEAGRQAQGGQSLWPAWIYCTRYSDRPSSGKCGYLPCHSD